MSGRVLVLCALALGVCRPISLAQDGGGGEGQTPDPVPETDASSGSNAGNYRTGASVQVNPRTGAVEANVTVFTIPGRSPGLDASISLSYSSTDRVQSKEGETPRPFGLPLGWSLHLSNITSGAQAPKVNVDGQQAYLEDSAWTSLFDSKDSFSTGLLQYNRGDSNLRKNQDVTVGNIKSDWVLSTLDGRQRYLSVGGLLLREKNRFGAHCDYFYKNGESTVTDNQIASIVDTWGNEITFDWTPIGAPEGSATMHLPDGRSVSIAWTDAGLTQVVDPQGKATVFHYATFDCDVKVPVLDGMVSPTGAMTSIEHQCLSVCLKDAEDGEEKCSSTTTWPVAKRVTACPNNPSGTVCAAGNVGDELVTDYLFGSGTEPNNYTGYPLFSPFTETTPPGADPVMLRGGGKVNFKYQTVSESKRSGTTAVATITEYDFLHRMRNAWHCAEAPTNSVGPCQQSGMALSKVETHCYKLDAQENCLEDAQYSALDANYQSAKVSGTCVLSVDGVGTPGVRLSVVEHEHNGFGHVTRTAKYHGTSTTGVATACTESTLLNKNQGALTLVSDTYTEYDLPEVPPPDGYFELGVPDAGEGHYGMVLGQLEYQYLEDDTTGLASHQALGSSSQPIRVTLSCYDLAEEGTVPANALPAAHSIGLVAGSTPKPTPGQVPQCQGAPPWIDTTVVSGQEVTVAPPRRTLFEYDKYGRPTSTTHTWDSSTPFPEQPGSTQSATEKIDYTVTDATPAEQAYCGSGMTVESVVHTSPVNETSVVRHCIQNGWLLSAQDPDGDVTTYGYDQLGLATRVTQPNGDFVATDYFYRCPLDEAGIATCPTENCPVSSEGVPICGGCPYPPAPSPLGIGPTCVVHSQFAGPGNQSFQSGVRHATHKDGLGRTVATYDNLGATGAGYTSWQQRSAHAYDSLGLKVAEASSVGVESPLVYTTTTNYNATFQPSLMCDPHGVSHAVVHDNVGQAKKVLVNGSQRSSQAHNDSSHVINQADCPIGPDAPTISSCSPAGDGTTTCCPVRASDTKGAQCATGGDLTNGSIYRSARRLDGRGTVHIQSATNPNAEFESAPIQEVSGTVFRDALLHKYGYSTNSVATTDPTLEVGAFATWGLDLNTRPVAHQVTLSNAKASAMSDTYDYDPAGRQTTELSKLGLSAPQELFYTPASQLSQLTDYAGNTFYSYYDEMKRLVRYCYPNEQTGGSEGRKYTYDSISGQVTSVTHFDNSAPCPPACPHDAPCPHREADEDGDFIFYMYNRFGALLTKTYVEQIADPSECPNEVDEDDGLCQVTLSWGYDTYHRPVCFADAVATSNKGGREPVLCPTTPIAEGFAPDPGDQLAWRTYYPQSDPYRRGLVRSACRGVIKDTGPPVTYESQCTDYDYYQSIDVGGGDACPTPTTYPQGALAGLMKTKAVCVGGSCQDGSGSPVYVETMQYDPHRRPCLVVSSGCSGGTVEACASEIGNHVLRTSFTYDQYDNVLTEVHQSDIDPSEDSNYKMQYQYDGLMRLTKATRTDLSDALLQTHAYTYDAFSNITERVVSTYDGSGGSGGSGGAGGAEPPPSDDPAAGGGCGRCTVGGATRVPVSFLFWLLLLYAVRVAVRGRGTTAGSECPHALPCTKERRSP